jgi:hypothetical protein
MKRENFWLGLLTLSPITALSAVFYPALSLAAIILLIIGIKGVMYDML